MAAPPPDQGRRQLTTEAGHAKHQPHPNPAPLILEGPP